MNSFSACFNSSKNISNPTVLNMIRRSTDFTEQPKERRYHIA